MVIEDRVREHAHSLAMAAGGGGRGLQVQGTFPDEGEGWRSQQAEMRTGQCFPLLFATESRSGLVPTHCCCEYTRTLMYTLYPNPLCRSTMLGCCHTLSMSISPPVTQSKLESATKDAAAMAGDLKNREGLDKSMKDALAKVCLFVPSLWLILGG